MSYVDLSGKSANNYPKVLLPREATVATVIDVSFWSGTKRVKEKDGTTIEKPSEKVILVAQTEDGKSVSCWQNAEIKKGSKPSYDTLSYTNASNLGILEEVEKAKEKFKTLEDVASFWKEQVLNKKIKFVPETIIPAEGERYSIIKVIDGFA
jgi:hypothetical protein